jgi:hypothetical protein
VFILLRRKKFLLGLSVLQFAAIIFTAAFAFDQESYFPRDFESSRERFMQHLQLLEKQGFKGERLTFSIGKESLPLDVVYFRASVKKRKLLLITSGNHGGEASAGSALQEMFLTEFLPRVSLEEVGVVLVHSLNPWGFKHQRRDTENGVNLNRNFDISEKIFATKNEGYASLQELFDPKMPVSSEYSFPALKVFWRMITDSKVTRATITEAMGSGQYQFQSGLNYGGRAFEPQTIQVTELFKKWGKDYSSILHIDIHTGLGKKGVLHLIPGIVVNSKSRALSEKLFQDPIDSGIEYTPPSSTGFYATSGDYADIFVKLFPGDEKEVVGITAEFGTIGDGLVDQIRSLNRMILENQGFHHGYKNAEVRNNVEKDYRDLFSPDDPNWKNSVLNEGRFLFERVINKF